MRAERLLEWLSVDQPDQAQEEEKSGERAEEVEAVAVMQSLSCLIEVLICSRWVHLLIHENKHDSLNTTQPVFLIAPESHIVPVGSPDSILCQRCTKDHFDPSSNRKVTKLGPLLV